MAWISSIKNIALIDDTLNFISAIWVTSTSITNWEFMSHFILCMHPFMLFSLSILKNHAMVKVTVFLRYFPTVKLLFLLPLLLYLYFLPSVSQGRQTQRFVQWWFSCRGLWPVKHWVHLPSHTSHYGPHILHVQLSLCTLWYTFHAWIFNWCEINDMGTSKLTPLPS